MASGEDERATTARAVQLAAGVIVAAILDLLQVDPHQWSTRPCGTCKTISALAGRDFGCNLYAKTEKRS